MSELYKIEGEKEFAYFRANPHQILQVLQRKPHWPKHIVELNDDAYSKVVKFDFINSLAGTKVIEQGTSHFVIRGGQYLFFRVEAINTNTSRIIPEDRLWAYWKFAIPLALTIPCVFPVLLTPLVFKLKKKQAFEMSKTYLRSFCKYLELQAQKAKPLSE